MTADRDTLTGMIAGTAQSPPRASAAAGGAAIVLLLFAVGYYAFLLTAAGSIGLFAPLAHGLTFNSMLLHLLDGRFDVDPAAVGHEGYLRGGAVYAYFGILPALLRAPLLALPDFARTDFTRVSCLAAVSVMALFKLLSLRTVWHSAAPVRPPVGLPLLFALILFGGAQIQFLRPSIFLETVLWAAALAAVFVFLVLRGWSRDDGFTPGLLSALAALAGLCLLTRVSTAVGLDAAVGLLWSWRVWREIRRSGQVPLSRRLPRLLWPAVVVLAFVGLAAFINQQRWGNPFVFVDLSRALILQYFPDRLARVHEYGEFNAIRLGFGLVYYFLPVWVLGDGSGQLLWSGFVARTIDSAELPPGSFLLSDPLLLGLALCGVIGLARAAVPRRAAIVLAAAGLAIPPVLMLTAISYSYRYRVEFYPLLELCAFVGLWHLLVRPPARIGAIFTAGVLASIVAAHGFWLLNAASPLGPASQILGGSGIVDFYRSVFQ